MPSLTLAEAQQIIDGATKKLEEVGVPMCVAVVDPRGDLIAMIRQDGTPWRSTLICQGKAVASAAWLRSSGELTDNAQSPVSRGLMAMLDGRMIPGQGALPVFRNLIHPADCKSDCSELFVQSFSLFTFDERHGYGSVTYLAVTIVVL